MSFIDSKQNKIVDFAITHRGVTYFGIPQGMEFEALSVIVDRWKNDMSVAHFCHDKNSKGRDVILGKCWDILEVKLSNYINFEENVLNKEWLAC